MAATLKPVNRRALRRYGEFWRALQMVGNALVEAERLAAKAGDATPAKASQGAVAHWSTPTPEELRAAAKKAGQSMQVMASGAKKWEAELISREWRR
ncbi:hypothetical protein [Pseudonocardia pini]|uniref:hypothetical protein n=1 Tax=Pseudonocardia pini TaxID=2758030 RepID=UPI0015F0657A|nr:hypothetical protein [Pseudonocardia pini]